MSGSNIERKSFGNNSDGEAVEQFILTNAAGASLALINYGAAVTRLLVPDKAGKLGDVVLGFDNLKQYETQSPYFGACIGRVGNRIAQGMFNVGQVRCCVPLNNGLNHLHGGFKGYDKRIWKAEAAMTSDGPGVRFQLLDPDATEGYPGNLAVTVICTLTNTNALKLQYYATTDKATPVNLTNHTYFNLQDAGRSNILGHVLKLYADSFTPTDTALIPTGEIAAVKGTPLDFLNPKAMGQDVEAVGTPKRKGYDHNLVLRSQDASLAKAAEVYDAVSGRVMEVWTTQPGIQFYTGNALDGSIKGKDGNIYAQHSAFCFETQHYPDSVNKPNFPNTILAPGQVYRHITEYRFSAAEQRPF